MRYKRQYSRPREKNNALRIVISDAILAGYNPKQIAAYFNKKCISFVTRRVNVKALKIKRMQLRLGGEVFGIKL